MYEGISYLIKHLHLHRLLDAAIHFVAFAACIRTKGIAPVLILCARYFVVFAFNIIRITHKWNLSFRLGSDKKINF